MAVAEFSRGSKGRLARSGRASKGKATYAAVMVASRDTTGAASDGSRPRKALDEAPQ
jgi:hypothetical protein